MRPMALVEREPRSDAIALSSFLRGLRAPVAGETGWGLIDYLGEIMASGMPGLRGFPERALRFELDSYLHGVVDREVVEVGLKARRPDAMRAWLRAYAAATATTASYTRILDAATPGEAEKPSKVTGMAYRDALTKLWLLDPVPAWSPTGSNLSRLGQAPKHHLADPALAARLLGATVESLLDGEGDTLASGQGVLAGQLFESLATLCVRVAAQASEAHVGHIRTRNGDHEIDLVVVRSDGKFVAIEVRMAASVDEKDVRHLNWIESKVPERVVDKVLINAGPLAYRREDGVAVVPLVLLGA